MAQRFLQLLQILLAVSLIGAGGESVEFEADSVLVSLSSHLKGFASEEEGW